MSDIYNIRNKLVKLHSLDNLKKLNILDEFKTFDNIDSFNILDKLGKLDNSRDKSNEFDRLHRLIILSLLVLYLN